MGIGGSIIDQNFMEEYLGMRVESVDEVEILRRMEEGIYNKEEYERALAWTKEHCKEGRDDNPDFVRFSREQKDKQWEFTVKMYIIIRDLIRGNKKLPDAFEEEKVGHNAICAGFQGQRQWTDHWPNCDYPEALLNSSFDFEGAREPMTFATENDVLNGISMLFMRLLTNRAQILPMSAHTGHPKPQRELPDTSLLARLKKTAVSFICSIPVRLVSMPAANAEMKTAMP